MATSKIRVQTFVDSFIYNDLQAFAQESRLSLSSAVEKILILHFKGEQQGEYKSEQPSLRELESRLTLLEQEFKAWREGEYKSEYDSEYVICHLVDDNIIGYWGKESGEAKCYWVSDLNLANTYQIESIAKRELTKLKKKFRNLDIRYNTLERVKLMEQN